MQSVKNNYLENSKSKSNWNNYISTNDLVKNNGSSCPTHSIDPQRHLVVESLSRYNFNFISINFLWNVYFEDHSGQ